MDETDLKHFPPEPEEPLASDCCGNGCVPCVFDIYQEELEMWKAECLRIENGDSSTNESDITDPSCVNQFVKLEKDQYQEFKIFSIREETHNTLRVRFSLPKNQSLGLTAGQHVIIREFTAGCSVITRQYTPISPVTEKGRFEFLFKIYPLGKMSNLIKSWKADDRVSMRGPMGDLKYSPNQYQKVLMLCAGTGIAPMCQVINAILQNEDDDTLIRLVYACKHYKDILAMEELTEWRRYWNFSCVYVLSQEPQDCDYTYKYGEEIFKGRITKELIQGEIGDLINKSLVLICGTRSFDTDMLSFVKELKVPEAAIHKF